MAQSGNVEGMPGMPMWRVGALSPDDLERLAGAIRPSWEVGLDAADADGGEPPGDARVALVATMDGFGPASAQLSAQLGALAHVAPAAVPFVEIASSVLEPTPAAVAPIAARSAPIAPPVSTPLGRPPIARHRPRARRCHRRAMPSPEPAGREIVATLATGAKGDALRSRWRRCCGARTRALSRAADQHATEPTINASEPSQAPSASNGMPPRPRLDPQRLPRERTPTTAAAPSPNGHSQRAKPARGFEPVGVIRERGTALRPSLPDPRIHQLMPCAPSGTPDAPNL